MAQLAECFSPQRMADFAARRPKELALGFLIVMLLTATAGLGTLATGKINSMQNLPKQPDRYQAMAQCLVNSLAHVKSCKPFPSSCCKMHLDSDCDGECGRAPQDGGEKPDEIELPEIMKKCVNVKWLETIAAEKLEETDNKNH